MVNFILSLVGDKGETKGELLQSRKGFYGFFALWGFIHFISVHLTYVVVNCMGAYV